MLDRQSKSAFLTKMVQNITDRGPTSYLFRFTSSVIDTTMGPGHNSLTNNKLPAAYSAWMIARFIINVILPNDVVAFCLAGRCISYIFSSKYFHSRCVYKRGTTDGM
jgi:hypothetical protein